MRGGDPRSRVIGPDSIEPLFEFASVSPRNVPTRALPGLIGRDNQLLACRPPCAARSRRGCGAGAAGRLLRAQRRVTLDPLIDLGSAVNEVSGRVDPDHHRAVDTVRVPPLVDHPRRVPALSLSRSMRFVAERDASGFDVVGLLRQRVAGEVNAASLKPLRARGEGLGVRAQRRFAEVVCGVLQRRRHPRDSSAPKSLDPR